MVIGLALMMGTIEHMCHVLNISMDYGWWRGEMPEIWGFGEDN